MIVYFTMIAYYDGVRNTLTHGKSRPLILIDMVLQESEINGLLSERNK